MKTTNPLISVLVTLLLLFNATIIFAQNGAETPKFITVTTLHWNMHLEDFDIDKWKAVEKEFLDKVTMKNEHIIGASFYLHRFTADNTEVVHVQSYSSWEGIEKAAERSQELVKEGWENENERASFFKKRDAYYSKEHSDEIYATVSGAKNMAEEPTKNMICYVRKSHFSIPENGWWESFDKLRSENKQLIEKNEYLKAYYPSVHAWGSDRTDFIEAFYLNSLADLDKMFDRFDELNKEAYPDEKVRKERGKKVGRYFTGLHSDYIYTYMVGLSK